MVNRCNFISLFASVTLNVKLYNKHAGKLHKHVSVHITRQCGRACQCGKHQSASRQETPIFTILNQKPFNRLTSNSA